MQIQPMRLHRMILQSGKLCNHQLHHHHREQNLHQLHQQQLRIELKE
jgi:hypothetical protein